MDVNVADNTKLKANGIYTVAKSTVLFLIDELS